MDVVEMREQLAKERAEWEEKERQLDARLAERGPYVRQPGDPEPFVIATSS